MPPYEQGSDGGGGATSSSSPIPSQHHYNNAQQHNNHRSPSVSPVPPSAAGSTSPLGDYTSSKNVKPGEGGVIDEPHPNDVLCGRGGRINSHEGNIRFRDIVHTLKPKYLAPITKKAEKAIIAAEVVQQIRSLNPPGRFLREDTKNPGKWIDIGDDRARKKAGQALREDAPDIRAEMGAEAQLNMQTYAGMGMAMGVSGIGGGMSMGMGGGGGVGGINMMSGTGGRFRLGQPPQINLPNHMMSNNLSPPNHPGSSAAAAAAYSNRGGVPGGGNPYGAGGGGGGYGGGYQGYNMGNNNNSPIGGGGYGGVGGRGGMIPAGGYGGGVGGGGSVGFVAGSPMQQHHSPIPYGPPGGVGGSRPGLGGLPNNTNMMLNPQQMRHLQNRQAFIHPQQQQKQHLQQFSPVRPVGGLQQQVLASGGGGGGGGGGRSPIPPHSDGGSRYLTMGPPPQQQGVVTATSSNDNLSIRTPDLMASTDRMVVASGGSSGHRLTPPRIRPLSGPSKLEPHHPGTRDTLGYRQHLDDEDEHHLQKNNNSEMTQRRASQPTPILQQQQKQQQQQQHSKPQPLPQDNYQRKHILNKFFTDGEAQSQAVSTSTLKHLKKTSRAVKGHRDRERDRDRDRDRTLRPSRSHEDGRRSSSPSSSTSDTVAKGNTTSGRTNHSFRSSDNTNSTAKSSMMHDSIHSSIFDSHNSDMSALSYLDNVSMTSSGQWIRKSNSAGADNQTINPRLLHAPIARGSSNGGGGITRHSSARSSGNSVSTGISHTSLFKPIAYPSRSSSASSSPSTSQRSLPPLQMNSQSRLSPIGDITNTDSTTEGSATNSEHDLHYNIEPEPLSSAIGQRRNKNDVNGTINTHCEPMSSINTTDVQNLIQQSIMSTTTTTTTDDNKEQHEGNTSSNSPLRRSTLQALSGSGGATTSSSGMRRSNSFPNIGTLSVSDADMFSIDEFQTEGSSIMETGSISRNGGGVGISRDGDDAVDSRSHHQQQVDNIHPYGSSFDVVDSGIGGVSALGASAMNLSGLASFRESLSQDNPDMGQHPHDRANIVRRKPFSPGVQRAQRTRIHGPKSIDEGTGTTSSTEEGEATTGTGTSNAKDGQSNKHDAAHTAAADAACNMSEMSSDMMSATSSWLKPFKGIEPISIKEGGGGDGLQNNHHPNLSQMNMSHITMSQSSFLGSNHHHAVGGGGGDEDVVDGRGEVVAGGSILGENNHPSSRWAVESAQSILSDMSTDLLALDLAETNSHLSFASFRSAAQQNGGGHYYHGGTSSRNHYQPPGSG